MHHYGLTYWGSLGCPVDGGFDILAANCDKYSQWRGWGYGPPKLFGVVYYADMLLLYDCGHLYVYGGGIELGLS